MGTGTVVLVGLGEMGGVFARAFLRAGQSVVPVLRGTDAEATARGVAAPEVVLVAVGEADLHEVLARIPKPWRNKLALLQNELLPRDWIAHGLDMPTVAVVWFEKKRGQDVKVILPTPLYGPAAERLGAALATLEIPFRILADPEALRFELVRKNLYILTTNIAGLEVGGEVGALWSDHRALTAAIADEVLAIQAWLVGAELPRAPLLDGMIEAFDADPAHRCMGRSAPGRLRRALAHADQAGLAVPTLRTIAARGLGAEPV